jgi:hypothetical protein
MNEQLFEQDRIKAAEFLNLAESGSLQAGLSPEQREVINQYVVEQRNNYINHAMAAQSGRFAKTSPAYIESIQGMNKVKSNLANLAAQQQKMAENQQQYLDDFQSDRISKANYDPTNPSSLMDVYTGKANVGVDEGGNLLFNAGGGFKKYSEIANYSLKAMDTANSMLDIFDKVYNSKYRLNNSALQQTQNRIKSIVEKGGRNELLSLLKDDLLPGFKELPIPEEYYLPENYSKLKDYFLQTIGTALSDVNKELPIKYQRNSGIDPIRGTATWTGHSSTAMEQHLNSILGLQDNGVYTITNFSRSNDAPATRYGGKYDYKIRKAGDKYSYEKFERDPETGKQMFAGSGVITEEELKTEFGGKPIQTTQAAGGILAENSLNDL